MLKVKKKSCEPFGICMLNKSANPAHFHPNWAGLAVFLVGKFHRAPTFFSYFQLCITNPHLCPPIFLAYFWLSRWCVMHASYDGGFTKIYLRSSVGIDLFMYNFRFIHEPYHKLMQLMIWPMRLIDLYFTIMRFQEIPLVELKEY